LRAVFCCAYRCPAFVALLHERWALPGSTDRFQRHCLPTAVPRN
jgi:hypothetical protein